MWAITIHSGFILKTIKVSQNRLHLSPKGTTLACRSSQNGHPTLSSFWHPASASQYPDSLCGLTGTVPGSQEYLGLLREPTTRADRPRGAPAVPHLPVAPRSPRLTGPSCPAHSSLPSCALRASQAEGSPLSWIRNSPALRLPLPNTKRRRLVPHPTLSVHTPPPTDAESGS